MKNTVLWSALFALVCTQVNAEVAQPGTQPVETATPSVPPATTPSTPQTTATTPAAATSAVEPVQPAAQPVAAQAPPVINCDYKIPATTKDIDQGLVLSWSEKALNQAFDFNPATLDAQMLQLKSCFTDQGWVSFNSALEKSGNLEAIKAQKLNVSNQVDGKPEVLEAKDNQWKISLPLQVVYQNDKEKVTQLLNINLTVGRKLTGDLGITQLIATPRTTAALPQTTPSPTPNNATSEAPAPANVETTPSVAPEAAATPGPIDAPTPTTTNTNEH